MSLYMSSVDIASVVRARSVQTMGAGEYIYHEHSCICQIVLVEHDGRWHPVAEYRLRSFGFAGRNGLDINSHCQGQH